MKHLKALGIKFFFVFIGLYIFIHFAVTFWEILLTSLIFTAAGYFIGDLVILPRAGNFITTLLDAAGIWVLGAFLYQSYLEVAPVMSAAIIAIVEWLYHYYIEQSVLQTETQKAS